MKLQESIRSIINDVESALKVHVTSEDKLYEISRGGKTRGAILRKYSNSTSPVLMILRNGKPKFGILVGPTTDLQAWSNALEGIVGNRTLAPSRYGWITRMLFFLLGRRIICGCRVDDQQSNPVMEGFSEKFRLRYSIAKLAGWIREKIVIVVVNDDTYKSRRNTDREIGFKWITLWPEECHALKNAIERKLLSPSP